jgi:hypothetical protein
MEEYITMIWKSDGWGECPWGCAERVGAHNAGMTNNSAKQITAPIGSQRKPRCCDVFKGILTQVAQRKSYSRVEAVLRDGWLSQSYNR